MDNFLKMQFKHICIFCSQNYITWPEVRYETMRFLKSIYFKVDKGKPYPK